MRQMIPIEEECYASNKSPGRGAAVPQSRWPDGYLTVLREAGVQEKTILYRVTWIPRFVLLEYLRFS